MKIFRKFLLFLLYIILGASAITGVVIGSYSIWNNFFRTRKLDAESNWDNLPGGYKEFSSENSLKVEFQISDSFNHGSSVVNMTSSGTAWSWYYLKNSEYLWDWYLITNFHVVNEAVAYANNLSEVINEELYINDVELLNYYKNNSNTLLDLEKQSFRLYQYDFSYPKYVDLITDSVRNSINSINIITDFNNDNLALFSESKNNNSETDVEYNLDMALIKISFDFTRNGGYINPNYQKLNIIEKYNEVKNNGINNDIDNNKDVYIAGNPAKLQQLIGVKINDEWKIDYKQLTSIKDKILMHLKAPYYYTKNWFTNFPLSSGASGSAVYAINHNSENEPISWKEIIPIGIYWGGAINELEMKPSIIPFIIDKNSSIIWGNSTISFNIFENFIICKSENKI
ncbi:MAG: hypothetical protein HDR43_02930 [Mycoplasma sp.]|nr:hypothetical protein [Mycoplasma sp.]